MIDQRKIFRWAFGDNVGGAHQHINFFSEKKSEKKYVHSGHGSGSPAQCYPDCSSDSFVRFLKMAKTSILSFQKYFPEDRFVVIYNGIHKLDFVKHLFLEASPSLLKDVDIISSKDFKNPYPFPCENSVWSKWVPSRLDLSAIEVFVDTDVICLSQPVSLMKAIASKEKLCLFSDFTIFFCETVCGSFWEDEVLQNRIPLNCGFVVCKPTVDLGTYFFNVARTVDVSGPHAGFLDEQGSFNVAVYNSDIPFYLLPRDVNVFGQELLDRWKLNFSVEVCHFIGSTKDIFDAIEPTIFRKIHDRNYDLLYSDVVRMIPDSKGRDFDMEET